MILETALVSVVVGGVLALVGAAWLRRKFRRGRIGRTDIRTDTVVERVREVGRLVGLEVCAKEIATSTKGLSWLPPAILSRARVAMIFQFEKQYSVDLGAIGPGDVRAAGPGRFRVTLPAVEGRLRLTDVTPYDISAGRALGLIEVIPIDAPTQGALMERAQKQAATLYDEQDMKWTEHARRSVEGQLRALLGMMGVEAQFEWDAPRAAPAEASEQEPESGLGRRGARARNGSNPLPGPATCPHPSRLRRDTFSQGEKGGRAGPLLAGEGPSGRAGVVRGIVSATRVLAQAPARSAG